MPESPGVWLPMAHSSPPFVCASFIRFVAAGAPSAPVCLCRAVGVWWPVTDPCCVLFVRVVCVRVAAVASASSVALGVFLCVSVLVRPSGAQDNALISSASCLTRTEPNQHQFLV